MSNVADRVQDRTHWLSLHATIRAMAAVGTWRGDLQARMVADPAVRANPVAFQEELRNRGPLARTRIGYIAVGHEVCQEVLRRDDFKVMTFGGRLPVWLQRVAERTRRERLHPLRPPSLLAVDPPDHTRYRKTVSAVFTRRAVTTLQERVQQTAKELLDELDSHGDVIDIVAQYCGQLPVTIISEILGVPEPDRHRILHLGELAAPSLDIGLTWAEFQRVERGITEFNAWLHEHIQQLRRNAGDDLMSQLIRTSQDGEYLTDLELEATAGLVLAAGFETTVNLLGNGIRMLLEHPGQLAKLRERPDLWANAVEEILRLDSPVQMTARVARTDTSVDGQPVRRGQTIAVYLAAANRDPAVFTDPHRFDVERDNANRHLSFSGGRHFCLGAALARAEGEAGLRTLFGRYPDLTLAGPGERRPTRVLRGWSSLPVSLGQTTTPSR